jgi:hypothetical protein
VQQPPPQPPWGDRPRQPWGERPQPPPPQQPPWGQPPQPQRPWGYQPPKPQEPSGPGTKPPWQRPGARPPWYRHPVGMALIGAVVVILLALIVPAFVGGDQDPRPAPTTGAAAATVPPPTAPAATTTSTTLPLTVGDRLGQAIQDELGVVGTVTQVTAPPGGPLTVTWEVTPAGSTGLTRNNARFGVMRIMRAVQQSGAVPDQGVRLVGRYQLPGGTAPTTVVRLRFASSTVARTDFDDRRYLEAFELADTTIVHPAFRG